MVPRNAPGALDMLRRDITNVTKYFMKRFRLDVDAGEVYNYVVGNVEVREEDIEEALEELLGSEGLNELMVPRRKRSLRIRRYYRVNKFKGCGSYQY